MTVLWTNLPLKCFFLPFSCTPNRMLIHLLAFQPLISITFGCYFFEKRMHYSLLFDLMFYFLINMLLMSTATRCYGLGNTLRYSRGNMVMIPQVCTATYSTGSLAFREHFVESLPNRNVKIEKQ